MFVRSPTPDSATVLPATATNQAEKASTGTAPTAMRARGVSVPDRFYRVVPRFLIEQRSRLSGRRHECRDVDADRHRPEPACASRAWILRALKRD